MRLNLDARLFPMGYPGFRKHKIRVLRIHGEERLNTCFSYDLVFEVKPALELKRAWMAHPWCMEIGEGNLCLQRFGYFADVAIEQKPAHGSLVSARLVPGLYRHLALRRESRIYLAGTVGQLLKELFADGQIDPQHYFIPELDALTAPRPFAWEHGEGGLEFLERICQEEGITWFFRPEREPFRMAVHFVDDTTRPGKGEPPPCPAAVGVPLLDTGADPALIPPQRSPFYWRLVQKQQALPSQAAYAGLRLSNPDAPLAFDCPVEGGAGLGRHLGQGLCDKPEEARRKLRQLQEALRSGGETLSAEGWVPAGAGAVILIDNKPRLVLESHLDFNNPPPPDSPWLSQFGLDRPKGALITHRLIDRSIPFRPLPQPRPWRLTGQVPGRIHGDADGAVAELDDKGRYKVVLLPGLPQVKSDADAKPETKPEAKPEDRRYIWVPRLQPYGGAGHGMHLPLHKGAHVLLAGMNGDPEQLVIVGVLPTESNPSIVDNKNPREGVIRTHGGSEIRFLEGGGSGDLALSSRGRSSGLVFSSLGESSAWGSQMMGSHCLNKVEITLNSRSELSIGQRTEMIAGFHVLQHQGDSYQVLAGDRQEFHIDGNLTRLTAGVQVECARKRSLLGKESLILGVLSAGDESQTSQWGKEAHRIIEANAIQCGTALTSFRNKYHADGWLSGGTRGAWEPFTTGVLAQGALASLQPLFQASTGASPAPPKAKETGADQAAQGQPPTQAQPQREPAPPAPFSPDALKRLQDRLTPRLVLMQNGHCRLDGRIIRIRTPERKEGDREDPQIAIHGGTVLHLGQKSVDDPKPTRYGYLRFQDRCVLVSRETYLEGTNIFGVHCHPSAGQFYVRSGSISLQCLKYERKPLEAPASGRAGSTSQGPSAGRPSAPPPAAAAGPAGSATVAGASMGAAAAGPSPPAAATSLEIGQDAIVARSEGKVQLQAQGSAAVDGRTLNLGERSSRITLA